ncbi:MAG: DNA adenine methylase [Balneola sp.]
MPIHLSPLRYPGGKAKFSGFLSEIVKINNPINVYVEPYAGGAGAALSLLYNNNVNQVIINDIDTHVYLFWKLLFENTDELIAKVKEVKPTLKNFYHYKEVYMSDGKNVSELERGFSAFFLNRTTRSGILTGGPIGGNKQESKWKIDCRFNKENLIKRIKLISQFKDRVLIFNLDAITLMKKLINDQPDQVEKTLFYLDPPYVEKGKDLYKQNYDLSDHENLNNYLKKLIGVKWVLSYDDVNLIRNLYQDIKLNGLMVNHFASKAKVGKELLIFSDDCNSSMPEKN